MTITVGMSRLSRSGREAIWRALHKSSRVSARIERIYDDEPQAAVFDIILDEPALVGRDLGQHFQKIGAVVVIANGPNQRPCQRLTSASKWR